MNTDNFWTDELVAECHDYINSDTAGVLTPYGVMQNIQYFKQSKQPPIGSMDYEILEFVTDYLGVANERFYRRNDGLFESHVVQRYNTLSEEVLLHNKASIHSVRRISDGEVFQIGDRVFHNNEHLSIEKFEIEHAFAGLMKVCFNEGGFLSLDKLPTPSPKEEGRLFQSCWFKTKEVNFIFATPIEDYRKELVEYYVNKALKIKMKESDSSESVNINDFIKGDRLYTQSEVDAMMEKAFNAARETDVSNGSWLGHLQTKEGATLVYKTKYPTFSDYKKLNP